MESFSNLLNVHVLFLLTISLVNSNSANLHCSWSICCWNIKYNDIHIVRDEFHSVNINSCCKWKDNKKNEKKILSKLWRYVFQFTLQAVVAQCDEHPQIHKSTGASSMNNRKHEFYMNWLVLTLLNWHWVLKLEYSIGNFVFTSRRRTIFPIGIFMVNKIKGKVIVVVHCDVNVKEKGKCVFFFYRRENELTKDVAWIRNSVAKWIINAHSIELHRWNLMLSTCSLTEIVLSSETWNFNQMNRNMWIECDFHDSFLNLHISCRGKFWKICMHTMKFSWKSNSYVRLSKVNAMK